MYVRVDLATGKASLEDARDCRRFHLSVVGQADLPALDAALGAADVGHLDRPDRGDRPGEAGDGEHAWVAIAAVRRLAAGQVDESWEADFEAMLAHAAGQGWMDEAATHVRAHIDWTAPMARLTPRQHLGSGGGEAPMLEGRTLWELLERRVEATPDDRMVVDERGDELTFAQYQDRVERAAAGLADRGIGEGDVVTWQLPTWIESLVLVTALSRLGASQNPILHIYRQREVGFCARQTGAKLLVVPTEFGNVDFLGMAQGIAEGIRADEGRQVDVLACDRHLPEGDPSTLPPPPRPADGDAVRWYFYTSGTTADPKGAQHTDQTLHAVARGMALHLELTGDDVNSLLFPFPHIAGPIWLFSSLMAGSQNILLPSFVPDQAVEVLGREGVTLGGSGTVFHQAYLKAQRAADHAIFPKIRAFCGGGAPKPPALHYELKDAFPGTSGVLSGYGLTEAPILVMATPDDLDEDLAETEGAPLPGVELKLVKTDGTPAAVGEEGEVRAKAPQLMKGYLDASLDEAAFDDEGFFRTGDLGVLNERNMLRITGRLKDIIIRNMENVSAKEVEDHLYPHPKVADVAVIGLPDARTGERVCAVVVTAEGQEPLGFDEMVEFLKGSGLMLQKVPEQLELVDVLPRNPAGKVLKNDLKARYEGTEAHRRR